jgi:hypothetical protein
MKTEKLDELRKLLLEFVNSDVFGMGEMQEMQQVNAVIDFVNGAIINNEQNNE